MKKRRPFIAGNWKMNGSKDSTASLVGALSLRFIQFKGDESRPFDMLVCPPFPYIAEAHEISGDSGLLIGAQDCSITPNGPHTGDVSPSMLKDVGAKWVILGHSERRTNHGETNAMVKDKAALAIDGGLSVIICVGETEAQKDSEQTFAVIKSQVSESLPANSTSKNTIIAYEPVWAIGTGRTPISSDIQAVHSFIRELLADLYDETKANEYRILYGGSVKPSNASTILSIEDVDGALVGGASLKVDDFWDIATGSI